MILEATICLALNIYHEARGESIEGQRAVAAVTLNRTVDPRWPNNTCDVVYQPYQFSWTTNPTPIKEPEAFALALNLALEAEPDPDFGTHYHAISIQDPWGLPLLGQVGNHRFYE